MGGGVVMGVVGEGGRVWCVCDCVWESFFLGFEVGGYWGE